MGYQESLYHVDSLAQAAGVRQAIRRHGREGGIFYFCVERSREDVYLGSSCAAHLQAPPEGLEASYEAGSLFVILGGDCHPCQEDTAHMVWLDCVYSLWLGDYADHFEEVAEDRVDAALLRDPEGASGACQAASKVLVEAIGRDRYDASVGWEAEGVDLCASRRQQARPPRLETADVEAAARALLQQGDTVTAAQVAGQLGVYTSRARYRLDELIRQGVLRKERLPDGRHVAYALAG